MAERGARELTLTGASPADARHALSLCGVCKRDRCARNC